MYRTKWWTLPRGHVKELRWVLVDVEAPPPGPTPNTPTDRLYSTLVNWTMTYHSHSDVVAFYGYFLSLNASVRPLRPNQMSEHKEAVAGVRRLLADGVTLEEAMGPSLNTYINKTRVVAWMSSHCPTRSRREEYVHHLNQYLPVDKYGSCGNLSCGRRHPLESHCWQTVLTHYSFYMAMENALCLDYISEKLYNPLLKNIVPVVWGDYSNYLPPNSYIDARQYHPEELANLLLNLHNDPVAYGRYHLWRAYLRPMVGGSMCELCHLLHTDTSHHHYHSIATARHLRGQCLSLPTKLFHPRHSTAWKQVIASNHSENKHKIPPQW
ncbi:alpha-(1,3)-fucosyltransferase C-like isoform X2 [Homarus americanus]|uniref:alpha-(1,3)-fucosyltransferase C-like isoform X2 n=1 Tax=Homarus americanus TaxID=6706 RepID=UPI001C45B0FC|nr:alpha-(1,3)-fucosyltransferase C-like isoform X2 [Homarus americanus]